MSVSATRGYARPLSLGEDATRPGPITRPTTQGPRPIDQGPRRRQTRFPATTYISRELASSLLRADLGFAPRLSTDSSNAEPRRTHHRRPGHMRGGADDVWPFILRYGTGRPSLLVLMGSSRTCFGRSSRRSMTTGCLPRWRRDKGLNHGASWRRHDSDVAKPRVRSWPVRMSAFRARHSSGTSALALLPRRRCDRERRGRLAGGSDHGTDAYLPRNPRPSASASGCPMTPANEGDRAWNSERAEYPRDCEQRGGASRVVAKVVGEGADRGSPGDRAGGVP
jgi:hypothetical protein